jgi:hypothetical protein
MTFALIDMTEVTCPRDLAELFIADPDTPHFNTVLDGLSLTRRAAIATGWPTLASPVSDPDTEDDDDDDTTPDTTPDAVFTDIEVPDPADVPDPLPGTDPTPDPVATPDPVD